MGIYLIFEGCQVKKTTLFEKLDAAQTQVKFENKLVESETENILAYEYFYNGGGVAAADFNNDGKIDLFFSGNQVPNKFYLNTTTNQNITFQDITDQAGVEGRPNGWKTGVAVADVNADGWLDIYLCYSGNGSPEQRKNQLFINNGLSKNSGGEVSFSEKAEAYGIADIGYSTHATFFDYDLDGDLDLLVLNHNLKGYQRKEAAAMKSSVDAYAGDRLYRNELINASNSISATGSKEIGSGVKFTDVTLKAGIKSNPLGFGLGVAVADFNQDNLPDLYVANDYVEEDYLYLNTGNGTFNEVGKEAFGHFSYSSMGVDAADFNNDGLVDLFSADMLPEDNRRQKLLAFPDNWNVQQAMLENGFHWQNMRNMLHLNQATSPAILPTVGDKKGVNKVFFSEIGQLAGVSNTDWSWSPIFADFDNDGLKDLFVSNGFVRDLTDLDFVKYYADEEAKKQGGLPTVSLLEQVKKMPSTPTHHYIFRNKGDLTFSNQVKEWGFENHTIAAGSVCADLDNDGDLDLITNNTNEIACIYQNQQQQKQPTNFLKIRLKGEGNNLFGLGSKVWLYANNQVQYQEFQPTHGFQSSSIDLLHFGLGEVKKIDSVRVVWPNKKSQIVLKPAINQTIELSQKNALAIYSQPIPKTLFQPIERINFTHQENFNIDFNRQVLLPKLYSRIGPKFAVADVNKDGLEDIFITTPKDQSSSLFLQDRQGNFKASTQSVFIADAAFEDCAATFFDADNDGDQDLYVASGGYEQIYTAESFQDRLYINDGNGNFSRTSNAIPAILTNKSGVKALDYDLDGDQDLFLSGAVQAGFYPLADSSYLLKNNGKGKFTIVQKFATGLLTDICIADTDADKYADIILVGEFMSVQILKNQKGNFASPTPLIEKSEGWYNRIVAYDLDRDGDTDFVVGNIGNNTPLHASVEKPLTLYYDDTDQNGTIDPLIFNYVGQEAYPISGRDETLEQIVGLRKKFIDYKSFSTATLNSIFDENALKRLHALPIYQTTSGIFINQNGKFEYKPLPTIAQASPVYAILTEDFNGDSFTDILLVGNESNFRIRIGKTDANLGVVLLNDGKNNFNYIPQYLAGLYLPNDVRDIAHVNSHYIFGVNNGAIKVYKKKSL